MANRFTVAIEPDERDFWHVNAYLIHDDPGDDGDIPDAVATTKKGATRDDAIKLARAKYKPERITVWQKCEEPHEDGECDDPDCEDGMVPVNIYGTNEKVGT